MTALEIAHRRFLASVFSQPRDLRALNSAEALAGRTLEIEAQLQAITVWLKALVEDTAAHCHMGRRPDDIVEAYMHDMAGELRGLLIGAMSDVEAA